MFLNESLHLCLRTDLHDCKTCGRCDKYTDSFLSLILNEIDCYHNYAIIRLEKYSTAG